jgi:transposase InsO family protein
LSWLTILDEPTRDCLALEVYRSVSTVVALDVLERSVEQLGAPDCLRSDGSRHLTARLVRQWLKKKSIQLLVTETGSPWENRHIEAFHRRMPVQKQRPLAGKSQMPSTRSRAAASVMIRGMPKTGHGGSSG